MGSVNVNRNVADAFYRYKMPRLMAKVEGKGNGIKTVIVNMVDVAKALGRPPTYPTKYFGCELGAQTQFDFKNDRFIVNGCHDAPKLQDLLDGFIRKFVLCPECDNPETELRPLPKKQTVTQSCKACGHVGMLDCRHRLITFILKNPPEQNPAAQGSSITEGKRSKRGKEKQNEEDGDVTAQNNASDEESDDDWSVDVSEEAVRARMQDLSNGVKSLAVTDESERTEKERVDLLFEFIKQSNINGTLKNPSTIKEVLGMAERLEIKHKAPLVLVELLCDKQVTQQLQQHRVLFCHFTHQDPKAQKYLLGGIELLVNLHRDVLLPKVPLILKALYDLDIVDEEVILEWGKTPSKKYISRELNSEVREKAQPFLKWLLEAEEEESDSDEDDAVEFNDRINHSVKTNNTNNKATEEDGDIDIDAI